MYSKEELVNYIKKFYIEVGKTPGKVEIGATEGYPNTYRFLKAGNWIELLRAAGLYPRKRYKYSEDDMIKKIKLRAKQLGRCPLLIDMANAYKEDPDNWYHCDAYYNKKKWLKWLTRAELIREMRFANTDDYLEAKLREALEIFGYSPTKAEFSTLEGFPPIQQYSRAKKRWTWHYWLKKCGVERKKGWRAEMIKRQNKPVPI